MWTISSLKLALNEMFSAPDSAEPNFLATVGKHQSFIDDGLVPVLRDKDFAPVKYLKLLKKTAKEREFSVFYRTEKPCIY